MPQIAHPLATFAGFGGGLLLAFVPAWDIVGAFWESLIVGVSLVRRLERRSIMEREAAVSCADCCSPAVTSAVEGG